MPRFTDEGFHDNINDLLDNLIDQPSYLLDQDILLKDLFDESFMKKFTDVLSFDDFLKSENISALTGKDLENISVEKLDNLAVKHTKFKTWDEMLLKAAKINFDTN